MGVIRIKNVEYTGRVETEEEWSYERLLELTGGFHGPMVREEREFRFYDLKSLAFHVCRLAGELGLNVGFDYEQEIARLTEKVTTRNEDKA